MANSRNSKALAGKITVLHVFSGDLWAGAEVVVFNLLNRLREYSDLRIIALSLNEGILTKKLHDAGLETYVIPEATYSFLIIFVKAFHLLKRKKIDIIHSHRYKENLLALLLAKSMGGKHLVTTLHGLSELPVSGKNQQSPIPLKTHIDYFFLNRFFTRVVAVSHEIKTVLVRYDLFTQKKVDVIYNGIPLPPQISSSESSTNGLFHIGTVGRMVPVKDFNLFLEVAAEIKKRKNNVRFSILGEGSLRQELIQRTKDLKIEDSMEFLSSRPDPFRYFQSLDLYLNTSLHEGIPMSILEAMACGKPVVAPNVGGIPEVISHREQGLLVEGRDPKDFADSCLALMQNQDLRAAMSKNAARKIESSFSSVKMAQSYQQLYGELCTRC